MLFRSHGAGWTFVLWGLLHGVGVALIHAIRGLAPDLVRPIPKWLAAGATVDVPSGPTRGTALHQASRRGYVSVARSLFDHGATIDARDAKGQTPLRRAVNCRQLQIVRLLVRHGADPRAADRRGVTPLDVARTAEMKQVLADAGD